MAGAKGRVNHRLLLVRMAILISQRDHVWGVICAEEDGHYKPGMSANKNLIVVVVEQCQNFTDANGLYFALVSFQLYIRQLISPLAEHTKNWI